MSSYHTGAGLNDVVFSAGSPGTVGVVKGFFNATNVTGSDNLLFDLGNDFAWGLKMIPNAQFYTAWQPVELDAGVSGSGMDVSGFFVNSTGLQWNSTSFGGWLSKSLISASCRQPGAWNQEAAAFITRIVSQTHADLQ